MKRLFDDFLNKKITASDLIKKLRKLAKYRWFKDINLLINDIENIVNSEYGKNEYEDILIVFHQYLDKRKRK